MHPAAAIQAALTEQKQRDLERIWLPRLYAHHTLRLPVLDLRDLPDELEALRQ